jgi:hypothetical protein
LDDIRTARRKTEAGFGEANGQNPASGRILGVNCTPACAFLAISDAGVIQPTPERLEWPAGEESERLGGLFQDAQALLREQRVDEVALLLPGRGGKFQPGYFVVGPRIALETVIRLAAVTLNIPVVVLERATVRARLKCGKNGALEEYLNKVVPQSIGKYRTTGRGLAAMAALATGAS